MYPFVSDRMLSMIARFAKKQPLPESLTGVNILASRAAILEMSRRDKGQPYYAAAPNIAAGDGNIVSLLDGPDKRVGNSRWVLPVGIQAADDTSCGLLEAIAYRGPPTRLAGLSEHLDWIRPRLGPRPDRPSRPGCYRRPR